MRMMIHIKNVSPWHIIMISLTQQPKCNFSFVVDLKLWPAKIILWLIICPSENGNPFFLPLHSWLIILFSGFLLPFDSSLCLFPIRSEIEIGLISSSSFADCWNIFAQLIGKPFILRLKRDHHARVESEDIRSNQ